MQALTESILPDSCIQDTKEDGFMRIYLWNFEIEIDHCQQRSVFAPYRRAIGMREATSHESS